MSLTFNQSAGVLCVCDVQLRERERENDSFLSDQVSEEEQKQRIEVPSVPSDTLTKKTGLLTQEVKITALCMVPLCGFLLLTLLALIEYILMHHWGNRMMHTRCVLSV